MSDLGGLRRLLLPLAPGYWLGLALRELGLRAGIEPVRRLRWPVASIGSLSAGGSGKTPLTIALAQALTRRGRQVDVLSRGYGRLSRLAARVDTNGAAEDYGDEPLLIAQAAGVAVYVAAQRYDAGLLAESERSELSRSGFHLLDDGFQHRQLHRDVDILLLDARDWFSESLLPAGNLREPLSALSRASVLAIPALEAAQLEPSLRGRGGWQGPIWRLHRRMEAARIDGPVAAFCGIARPAQFFEGLESAGLHLAARLAFADHHRYTPRDLDHIAAKARAAGATALITTEKDRVRLGQLAAPLPLHTVRLRIEIEDEPAALDWLEGQLASAGTPTPDR
ncbi:MAG: tetraacyldisaccharide 4'-kinase [Terracidiphilus sp.]